MREVNFPNWEEVLKRSQLAGSLRRSFAITIGWYLSFCRRSRVGVNVQSARDFIDWAQKEKAPEDWKVESWKQAIRWFFRTSKGVQCEPSESSADELESEDDSEESERPWRERFIKVIRRRHYSYRTEQSYGDWLERFARYLKTDTLEARGPEDVAQFLDDLATNQGLSASSQSQALNALVFLYREVFKHDLGDLAEYRQGKPRTNAPVWLTPEEMDRLLKCLPAGWDLMAKLMYGGGLRLMELLRLRVKDVDLIEEIITVRRGKGSKGGKDRFVPLAHAVVDALSQHMENSWVSVCEANALFFRGAKKQQAAAPGQ